MNKKRILLSTESSLLNTGYATMTVEIAKRLQQAGHEVGEIASYAHAGDQRLHSVPWRVYPVVPHHEDKEGRARYEGDPYNQFGKQVFEEACIDFRCTHQISFRDNWMDEHIARSPLRPFYRHILMPTVDAEPQAGDWLDTFGRADAVFTYTDWAADLLREQAGDRINVVGSSPPGVDHDLFRPIGDKAGLRSAFGVPADALVVGFISRNQQRKRFPEFAEAFRHFLDTAPAEVAGRALLYWHTSWPDVGWNIPLLLRESGIASRVLFTYKCRSCGHVFASRWMDSRNVCVRCGQPSATPPNTNAGLAREEMLPIYNLFDVYVQYCNSEGFGLGLAEAAACGVPVMATDYSAMSCIVRKLQGTPIAVKAFYREVETGCKRAIPDGEDFSKKLLSLLTMPDTLRRYRGGQARSAAIRHYDWDQTIQKWLNVIESTDPELSWDSPYRPHQPAANTPPNLSNSDFIRWGFCAVAGRPDLADSYVAQKMLRDLNWGATLTGSNNHFHEDSFVGRNRVVQEVTRDNLMGVWRALAAERDHFEQRRMETVR